MKYVKISSLLIFIGLLSNSCSDDLDVHVKGKIDASTYFTDTEVAVQSVTAAYAPLGWEYNNTYYPEWFIGDVVSDDALKGGQSVASDMASVYELENFKTQSSNQYLLEFYKAQYIGIFRSNLVIENVPGIENLKTGDATLKERVMGEAHFLRAYYYFRLVRIFGGVPKIDTMIKSQYDWKQPRASADEIYQLIIADLEYAQQRLPKKSAYAASEKGRATKGAAQAMLMKSYMNLHQYDKAKAWGDSIINSGEYNLCTNYADNFTLDGENGPESVFEVQYIEDGTGDYGDGNGFTTGTFTVIMTRYRSNGWGFNRPTKELYNEFELSDGVADPRRAETIYDPVALWNDQNPEVLYLGDSYHSKKYALIDVNDGSNLWSGHAARGPINRKEIRYADILLMYAEACCETGNTDRAKWALEKVRNRARGGNTHILPAFPYGNYSDNKADLVKAIRHERRVELGMEGHRWFDLVRWGIAAETMNNYRANASAEIREHMASFVQGKHELFPLPLSEIQKNPMEQNPQY